jgi:RNA polymerase primary sigma factor
MPKSAPAKKKAAPIPPKPAPANELDMDSEAMMEAEADAHAAKVAKVTRAVKAAKAGKGAKSAEAPAKGGDDVRLEVNREERQTKIRELVKLAQEQGFVTYDDVNEAIPETVVSARRNLTPS